MPFILDVYGGVGEAGQTLLSSLLKGILSRQDAWQRRGTEASIWQLLSVSLMREIGKQLVWSVFASPGLEDDSGPASHEPYEVLYP